MNKSATLWETRK